MNNERRNNIPLVSRNDILKKTGLENEVTNVRYCRRVERGKIQRDFSKKIVAISVAASLAIPVIMGGAYVHSVGEEVKRENEVMSQTYSADEQDYAESFSYDETRPYSPDNLVFDEVVHSYENNADYRLVVRNDGECSFVSMNYDTPFQFLDGVDCEVAAKNLGFDFDSMSKGHSR